MSSPNFLLGHFYEFKPFLLTWIIHESRLPQVRGVAHEAAVIHRDWARTKQMQ